MPKVLFHVVLLREAPPPKDPSMFPTFPSKAAGEKQRAFKSPTAPHAHHDDDEADDQGKGGSIFDLQSSGAGAGFVLKPR